MGADILKHNACKSCRSHGLTLLFISFSIAGMLSAQNYIDYQKTFNRIDEDVLTLNYKKAIERLDSIDTGYEFVYARHCLKALQICVVAKDSTRANHWLVRCIKRGIPLWIIRSNELSRQTFKYETCRESFEDYDSLHNVYLLSIDRKLSAMLDSILDVDQKYTRKVNSGFVLLKPIFWFQWGRNNKRQFEKLKMIIETYGYPEEKLVGLPGIQDSAAFFKYFTFWGPSEIRDSRMQIMLQHCFSTWHNKDTAFINTLYSNMRSGNMPVFQYALVTDFMFPDKNEYAIYNFWIGDRSCDSYCCEMVALNRNSIGLSTYENEKRNDLIERERRKLKKSNSEIVLE